MKKLHPVVWGFLGACAILLLSLAAAIARTPTADAYNGLLVYTKPGYVAPLVTDLKAKGFKVGVRNHTEGKRTSTVRDLEVGHSMGGNAILKKAWRLKKKPQSIVTVDPGRAPLFHRCPPGVRCVNIYCPWHPIGGQSVEGAENIWDCSRIHGGMPHSLIVRASLASEADRVLGEKPAPVPVVQKPAATIKEVLRSTASPPFPSDRPSGH